MTKEEEWLSKKEEYKEGIQLLEEILDDEFELIVQWNDKKGPEVEE